VESWQGVDHDLSSAFRALRLEIARSRGVPPYVIFRLTLRLLAPSSPRPDALRHVYGVGERKAADLGERFVRQEGFRVGGAPCGQAWPRRCAGLSPALKRPYTSGRG
jgi:hypothetical protein